MLELVTEDVFTIARPLRFLGVEMGTRATVIRLGSGGLFVHSPVALDAETKAAVDALGVVEHIVAPTLFHHLFVGEWARAYPDASVWACPGLEKKRADVRFGRVLGNTPEAAWKDDLEQVFFGAFPMANEVIFFHRKSSTIVCSDFIFNLSAHSSWLTRAVNGVVGHKEPGVTLLERLAIKDRAAARQQVGRVVDWGAERIVLAHGDLVASNAQNVVANAYRWLDVGQS
jgi:hypothetical protein